MFIEYQLHKFPYPGKSFMKIQKVRFVINENLMAENVYPEVISKL